MDPIGGAASIITLVALSKSIVQKCRKYAKDYRDAPAVLSRFCDEVEALTILFDQLLILQHSTQTEPSCQSSVLIEVLCRTNLLKDYEYQLKKLEVKIHECNVRNIRRRLLFLLHERQILDGLNVVQRIRSTLKSALQFNNI